jgi:hypothetical protein
MDDHDRILTDQQIEFFIEHRYLALDDCFPRELGRMWMRDALLETGIDPDRPETYPRGHFRLSAQGGRQIRRAAALRDFSPRVWGAACQLLGGAERIDEPVIMNDDLVLQGHVPGEPWAHPLETGGWHIDGRNFNRFIDSHNSGLFWIALFSDVPERGGGTCLALDSIEGVARVMLAHPQGLPSDQISRVHNPIGQCRRFEFVQGRVGRYYLMHPLMVHTQTRNTAGVLRALHNSTVPMRRPLNFDPDRAPLSPLERSTLRALGVDRLDFTPPPPELRFLVDRETGERSLPPLKPDGWRRSKLTVGSDELARWYAGGPAFARPAAAPVASPSSAAGVGSNHG